MVNMTNSLYTHQPNNNKKENDRSTKFMDINADEAEAGSILMSLSQQTKKRMDPLPTTKTMSIRNLLGDEEEQVESKQTKWNNADTNNNNIHNNNNKSILLSNDMHRFPETTKKTNSHLYPERLKYNNNNNNNNSSNNNNNNNTIHSNPPPPPHPTATTSLPLPPSRQRSDSINNIQQQKRYLYPHPSNSPTKSFHDQHSFSQQPLQSMKNNPKVKRNALHAYISYMTYSDMTKQKSNNPISYNHHSTSSMVNPPITPLPTNFSSDRSNSPPPPPPSIHHQHHPLPLTAYLKQHIDTPPPPPPTSSTISSSTSSSLSNSSSQQYHSRQRTYSNGWSPSSHPSYHPHHHHPNDSSSMNSFPSHHHPHYQYPYPYSSSSSSMKHPYDKNI